MLPDNHPLFMSSRDVESICQPLFTHLNIKHFAYVAVQPDLSRIHLSNSTKWSRHFYLNAERYYSEHEVLEFNHSQSGWTTFKSLNEVNCIQEAREHGIGDGLVISINKQNITELFFMAYSSEYLDCRYNEITLIQNMDLLRSFLIYFKRKASNIIKNSYAQPIKLSFINNNRQYYINSFNNVGQRKQFLEAINPALSSITFREYQCATHLLEGRSLSETSLLMNISYKTLEKHMSSLRKKTNSKCNIALLQRLNQYMR